MDRVTLIRSTRYEKTYQGGSVTGNLVEIIGEGILQDNETGDHYDCYLYNIVGYTAKNGKPFVARKENIVCLEPIPEEHKAIQMGEPENHDPWEELRRLKAQNVW